MEIGEKGFKGNEVPLDAEDSYSFRPMTIEPTMEGNSTMEVNFIFTLCHSLRKIHQTYQSIRWCSLHIQSINN
jgi:hypothetical protein